MTTIGKIKKVFPIQNSSACVFKWGWNTFKVYNGVSSSCHRVESQRVTLDTFKDFHNTPAVLEDRRLMLEGQWPGRGCEYCKNIEAAGGISDRLYHNQIPGLTPGDFDGSVRVSPSISEIYLNNVCDLACVYCPPVFSAKINNELIKFGPYPVGFNAVEKHPQSHELFDAYIDWLKENSHKLVRLSVLGGEPLLQKEFWKILELLKTVGHDDLEVAINTNLNCDQDTIERLVAVAKELTVNRNIKRLHVSASLDCWGPQAEFVRFGLDLENWQRNFEYLMNHRWIALSIHQVIMALTIKTANQLQDKIAEYKKTHPRILQEYHFVDSGFEKVYHPEMFGREFFREPLHKLLEEFPVATEWDKFSRQRLEGIVQLMDRAEVDRPRLAMLKQTLDQINLRRNVDWQPLWPELKQHFESLGI